MKRGNWFLTFLLAVLFPFVMDADESKIAQKLEQAKNWPRVIRSNVGVTGQGTPIPCLYTQDDLDLHTRKTRILLVAGFQNSASTDVALDAMEWFYASDEAKPFHRKFSVSAIPLVNPDGAPAPAFPPKGDAYNSQKNTEAEYVWRWIGMHAPDWVVGLTIGKDESWSASADANHSAGKLVRVLGKQIPDPLPHSSVESLSAMMKLAPADVGTIPEITAVRKVDDPRPEELLKALFREIEELGLGSPSSARVELQRRVDRTALEIAKELSSVYGHELPTVEYIPAMALVGRLSLGEFTKDAKHIIDVERIVAPYVAGDKLSLPKNFAGSHLSGHLIFAQLARSSPDDKAARYKELVRRAADTGFDAMGKMKVAMPTHSEMSDAVFMACPILIEAGALTGEEKYYEMAERHFDFMKKLVLREDGIYRHSPLCETAWGRGNGFPALGLALCLSRLPQDHPLHRKFREEFQAHMAALVKLQDSDGMWHQVIDDDASYRELSCTCMIAFSMIRGVRSGWLEEAKYRPAIDRAFRAIKARIGSEGNLVDVCTGTGKQKSLRDYYDRKAILGRDSRGGAMSLLVTTEMADWEGEQQIEK